MKRRVLRELWTFMLGGLGIALVGGSVRRLPEEGFWTEFLWGFGLYLGFAMLVEALLRLREQRPHLRGGER